MKIHREGYQSIVKFWIFALIVDTAIIYLFHNNLVVASIVTLFTLFLGIFLFNFFRIPQLRPRNHDDRTIYSPADGKIVTIEKIHDTEFFNAERLQISIFMSVKDVHINWIPIDGKIIFKKYYPGKHLVAFNPKSSLKNERASIVIETADKQQLLVRQVAGILARRVVNYINEGDTVSQFDEIGIIKFGSRVDLLLPPDVEVKVEIGQQVYAIEDAIATLA
jgi:phosphatidylserine decarboxylase